MLHRCKLLDILDEKRDLYSQSIGVRHESKDGKNNQAGKQRCDLIVKKNVLLVDVMKDEALRL